MSKKLYDYYNGYSEDGVCREENSADLNRIKLKLRGMANLKYFKGIETKVLGHPVKSPIGIAPVSG